MRRRLSTLMLLLLGATACGDEPMRVPPPPAGAGSIIIRWSLEDPDGVALNCADLQIAEAEVAIGGTPVVVPCGETEEVSFENVIPGRVPVVIRLLNSIGLAFASHIDNAIIEDQMELEYTHVFVVDEEEFQRGTLDINWRIDTRVPAQTCGLIGATTMRVATRSGSISMFEMDADCEAGQLIIPEVRRGGYDFIFWLVAADGTLLEPPETRTSVGVFAGDTTRVSLNFRTVDPRPRTVLTRWTVQTSTPTADNCFDIGGEEVRVDLETPNPLTGLLELTDTATTSCASGSATVRGEQTDGAQLTARLVDTFGGTLVLRTVEDLDLRVSSATVSVDFTPED